MSKNKTLEKQQSLKTIILSLNLRLYNSGIITQGKFYDNRFLMNEDLSSVKLNNINKKLEEVLREANFLKSKIRLLSNIDTNNKTLTQLQNIYKKLNDKYEIVKKQCLLYLETQKNKINDNQYNNFKTSIDQLIEQSKLGLLVYDNIYYTFKLEVVTLIIRLIKADQINPTIRFINCDNTVDTNDNLILGGFNKLATLITNGILQTHNIIVNLYGEFFNEEFDGKIYIPDPDFSLLSSSIDLTEIVTGQRKKDYKSALWVAIGRGVTSGNPTVTAEFKLIPFQQPEQYNHQFRYGKINCFLKSIVEQLQKGQRTKNQETINVLENKIKLLNDKYFNSGVSMNDIPNIEKKLQIKINIINKANQEIYTSNVESNKQTITLKTPYINHIGEYIENEIEDIKNKNLVVVDNIMNHYQNNKSDFKYFKKNIEGDIIYYYDELNLYYKEVKINDEIVNDENFYIYNELSYYQQKFNEDNNLINNYIDDSDKTLFEFINNSVHHLYKYSNLPKIKSLFKSYNIASIKNKINYEYDNNVTIKRSNKSLLDIDDEDEEEEYNNAYNGDIEYYGIDNNKSFIGFLNENTPSGKIYKKMGIPDNKFNFYKVDIQPSKEYINKILNSDKISYIEINNVIIINETIKNMNVIKNNNIYTNFFLKYCIDSNIITTFDLIAIATANGNQYLKFCKEIIDNKYYNEIIGTMSSQSEYKTISYEVKNKEDIKDVLYYNSKLDNNDKIYIKDNIITLKTKKYSISNKAHISSVILSYALINIIDVVKDIDSNNLLQVKADAIYTLKPFNIKLSKDCGEWKKDDKKEILIDWNYNNYINLKNKIEYNDMLLLSEQKQNYTQINFISGEAGTGKTTQFLKKFDTKDERLYNSLLLVPSNCLLYELQRQNKDINLNTYQGFIMAFTQMEDTHRANKKQFIKYTNIILDESTMINSAELKQILKITNENNFNLFIVGDYDIVNKFSYQLKPVTGNEFFEALDNNLINNSYKLHLTKNHRQNNDIEFYNILKNCRGKSNEYIKNYLINSKKVRTIEYKTVIETYRNKDKILSSVNKFIDEINDKIKPFNNEMVIMYKTTTKKYAKNETAIIDVKDFDEKKHMKGYAQTSHKSQGLTFENKIYINLNNLFTDNILYVMITRAKRLEQIYLIVE